MYDEHDEPLSPLIGVTPVPDAELLELRRRHSEWEHMKLALEDIANGNCLPSDRVLEAGTDALHAWFMQWAQHRARSTLALVHVPIRVAGRGQ